MRLSSTVSEITWQLLIAPCSRLVTRPLEIYRYTRESAWWAELHPLDPVRRRTEPGKAMVRTSGSPRTCGTLTISNLPAAMPADVDASVTEGRGETESQLDCEELAAFLGLQCDRRRVRGSVAGIHQHAAGGSGRTFQRLTAIRAEPARRAGLHPHDSWVIYPLIVLAAGLVIDEDLVYVVHKLRERRVS